MYNKYRKKLRNLDSSLPVYIPRFNFLNDFVICHTNHKTNTNEEIHFIICPIHND